MTARELAIVAEGSATTFGPNVEVLRPEQLRGELKSRAFLKRFQAYERAELHLQDFHSAWRPFVWSLLLRYLSAGEARVVDGNGEYVRITLGRTFQNACGAVRDTLRAGGAIRRTRREVHRLLAEVRNSTAPRSPRPGGRTLYLRSDLIFGLVSGGSVGHTAGVLNNLAATGCDPVFVTPDRMPTVDESIETHVVRPTSLFANRPDVRPYAFGPRLERRAREVLGDRPPRFVYHRYAMNDYSGVRLARSYGVPLVLEFNGSEVWASRNWGTGAPPLEKLAGEIEELNLRAADLIVVVSEPLRAQIVELGIPAERVLVNPNGVDPERYSPNVCGAAVREKHAFGDATVIGFIGTFGRWHGAEVLADAFGRLVTTHPELRSRLRLLMIGDGPTMPEVRRHIAEHGIHGLCTLTGLIPQSEGPAHLAACDVLASPHVPNPDGTEFFGSPTKLFEYMAMQRGIVASSLGQIGDILEHDRTAWMVPPGDVEGLVAGLKRLIDDVSLRDTLGKAAREEVLRTHSWRRHTERILGAIEERLGTIGRPAAGLRAA